jgi:hypothetical protein
MMTPPPSRPSDRRLWNFVDGALLAAGLWLALSMPVALAGGANDDYHYARLATEILDGHWLGPFDQLTLSTGAFFPVFLAAAAALVVPIQIAIRCVYLLGAVLLARGVGRITGNRAGASFCLALLVFSPVPFDFSAYPLLREPLYDGLTLVVLGLATWCWLTRPLLWRNLLLGLALGMFWLTREEGVVLLPSLGLLALWSVWPDAADRLPGISGFVHAIRWRRAAVQIVVPAVGWLVPVLVVSGLNDSFYGVFRTNDFQNGPFPQAYGALARIKPDHWQAYVPVSNDALQRAYAVSPAARELEPYLQGEIGQRWTGIGCTNHPIPDCHDLQAGWFMWALRESITAAGHYGSAIDADRFLIRLAHQIDAACEAGTLPCLAPRQGYLPPLRTAYLLPFLHSVLRITRGVLQLGPVSLIAPLSAVDGLGVETFSRVTQASPLTPPMAYADARGWLVWGWFVGRDPSMRLSIGGPPATVVWSDMRYHPDPGLIPRLHRDATIAQRFVARVRCQPGDCALLLTAGDTLRATWPLASLKPGWLLDKPDVAMLIDRVEPRPRELDTFNQPTLRSRVLALSARLLPILTTIAVPLAGLWILAMLVLDIRRRRLQATTVLGLAIGGAIAARVAMLALLEATSFFAEFRYQAPALTLALALVGLAIPAMLRAYSGARHPDRQEHA